MDGETMSQDNYFHNRLRQGNFTHVLDVPKEGRVDAADPNNVYVGTAKVGSLNSDPAWLIQKITTAGTTTTLSFAGGNTVDNKIWNSRATYTYSS